MAEAVAIVAAISSFLQILDFAGNVATHAYELANSSYDGIRKNVQIQKLTEDYERIAAADLSEPTVNTEGDVGSDTVAGKGPIEKRSTIALCERCRQQAKDLLNLLQQLEMGATSPHMVKRLWASTQKAAKAVRLREEIEQRRKLLLEINGQIATALLQDLQRGQQRQQSQLVEVTDALRMINRTLDMEEELQVLECLSFEELPQRLNAIPPAYESTYEWMFDDKATNFSQWLSQGVETYWINGQAGAGNSTLMKFLASHDKTMELLENWVGTDKLVFAEYYFWYLGSNLQKSIEGFLRSVLFQMLKTDLSLTRKAFPDLSSWRLVEKRKAIVNWTEEALIEAIRRLTRQDPDQANPESAIGSSRFCFFVDGLDELSGDHSRLVHLLEDLERELCIKLCVSSRPWNAFRMAYAGIKPALKLQDLTRPDIKKFVSGRLSKLQPLQHAAPTAFTLYPPESSSTSTTYQDLVTEIVNKAEGCFLWVHIAVASVLRGFSEGDSIAILLGRVRALPSDLEEFFRLILSRVEDVYSSYTAQVLRLVQLSVELANRSESESQILSGLLTTSFFSYWLIHQLPQGLQSFESIYAVPCRNFTLMDEASMLSVTENFISACSKDLLWLDCSVTQFDDGSSNTRTDSTVSAARSAGPSTGFVMQEDRHKSDARGKRPQLRSNLRTYTWVMNEEDGKSQHDYGDIGTSLLQGDESSVRHLQAWQGDAKVQFLHRTVYDFLCTSDVRRHLEERLPSHFKNDDILHLLNLAHAKFIAVWTDDEEVLNMGRAALNLSSNSIWPGKSPEFIGKLLEAILEGFKYCYDSSANSYKNRPIGKGTHLRVMICLAAAQDLSVFSSKAFEDSCDRNLASQLLRAALGMTSVLPIPMSYTEPQLVKRLFDLDANPNFVTSHCYRSLWQRFVAKWVSSKDEHGERDFQGSRRIKRVAELFIRAGADLNIGVGDCRCHSCPQVGTFDTFVTIATLLKIHCRKRRGDELAQEVEKRLTLQ